MIINLNLFLNKTDNVSLLSSHCNSDTPIQMFPSRKIFIIIIIFTTIYVLRIRAQNMYTINTMSIITDQIL